MCPTLTDTAVMSGTILSYTQTLVLHCCCTYTVVHTWYFVARQDTEILEVSRVSVYHHYVRFHGVSLFCVLPLPFFGLSEIASSSRPHTTFAFFDVACIFLRVQFHPNTKPTSVRRETPSIYPLQAPTAKRFPVEASPLSSLLALGPPHVFCLLSVW